jgi:hypothetical protein
MSSELNDQSRVLVGFDRSAVITLPSNSPYSPPATHHIHPPPTLINQRPLHPYHPFSSLPPRLRSTPRPCLPWASKSLPRTNPLSAIQLSRLPSLVFSTFCPQLRYPSINTGASNMLLSLPVSANPGSSLHIALPQMQPVTGTFLSTLYYVNP